MFLYTTGIVQVIGRNNHLKWRWLPPWLINTGRDKTLYDPPCTGQLLLRRLTYGTTSPWLSQPSNPLGLIKNMQPPAPEEFALPKNCFNFLLVGPLNAWESIRFPHWSQSPTQAISMALPMASVWQPGGQGPGSWDMEHQLNKSDCINIIYMYIYYKYSSYINILLYKY